MTRERFDLAACDIVSPDIFAVHFPGAPTVPLSLLADALLTQVETRGASRDCMPELAQLALVRPVRPDDVIYCDLMWHADRATLKAVGPDGETVFRARFDLLEAARRETER